MASGFVGPPTSNAWTSVASFAKPTSSSSLFC
jgi:hypothetical protein